MSLANGNAIRLPRSTSIRPPYQKVSFSIFMSFLWWNDDRLPAHKSSNFHTKEPRRRNCRGSYNTSLITYTIRYQTLGGSFGAHNLGGMQAVLRGFLNMQFLATKKKPPPKNDPTVGGWRCCFFFVFLRSGAELILFITRPRMQYH